MDTCTYNILQFLTTEGVLLESELYGKKNWTVFQQETSNNSLCYHMKSNNCLKGRNG